MEFTSRNGSFNVSITGGLLTASRVVSPLFTLPLKALPWFVLHSDGLYAQNAHDALTPLYRGDDAKELLACLTDVLHAREHRCTVRRRLSMLAGAIAIITAGWFAISLLTALKQDGRGQQARSAALNVPAYFSPPAASQGREVPQQSNAPRNVVSTASVHGWDLPLNVRSQLPAKLKSAAEKGIFTVPLSSGHERTLYVFADPECENCQKMERHYETAAGKVNVVIFPVTIEGGESSLKSLTPVMAMPETQRAAAWKQLFAADAGVSVPGHAPGAPVIDETQAETARGAIGVNEVAYRAWRLPGTPWTISDDGRYVPQRVLSSPAALEAFLNGGDHDGQ